MLNPDADTIKPWTIKAFPTDLKDTIIKAAAGEGMTVGAWLERLVHQWLNDGSPVRVQPENQVANQVSAPQTSLLEAVQALAVLVQLPADDPLVRVAKSSTRAALTASRQASVAIGKTLLETASAPRRAAITSSETSLALPRSKPAAQLAPPSAQE